MEPISIIVEMTICLLYLATSVFILVGGFVTFYTDRIGKRCLLVSLTMYGISLLAGLSTMMQLVEVSKLSPPDINDTMLRLSSSIQILFIGGASIVFFIYLCLNPRTNKPME